MARVFTAVNITDDETLEKLVEIRDTVNLDFTTVPREKMHITLEFFQDIDEQEINEIKSCLENIELNSFRASIQDIGAFPSEDFIRVVWAGVKSHKIYDLRREASTHSVNASDRNSFTPHITLLRVNSINKRKKRHLKKNLNEYRDFFTADFEVDNITLFESIHENGKTDYRKLKVKKL